ncbi:MAG: hypothetical protein HZB39_02880 [Planctomycetes bacterium]|nr:hypothetical protein [Planctomycetota bacterium]
MPRQSDLIVALALAATAWAQQPAPPIAASRPASFCEAWLREQLDRDAGVVRAAYARAAADEPDREARLLALAGLVEVERVLGGDAEAERAMAILRERFPAAFQRTSLALELPRAELELTKALPPHDPAREQAIQKLRDASEAFSGRRTDLGRWVEFVVVRRLETEAQGARADSGATESRPAPAALSTWREHAVRMLAAGRFQDAERLAWRIRGDDGGSSPAAALDDLRARTDLGRSEREALDELARKLADWERAGRGTDAARARAALPYPRSR